MEDGMRPMEIFVDCEFNGYRGALMTLALVAMDGRELYRGVELFEEVTEWVRANVVPVIGDCPFCPTEELPGEIAAFLAHYPQGVHLIADWPDDIRHFCDALITGPGTRIDTPPLTMEVRRDLDAVSEVPHNALFDARAIRDKYYEVTND